MEIWQEIIKNRERGARALVAIYQDRLFAAALILCRDPRVAEELLFRTFARAVAKISSFRPSTSFYNWLYTIMINFRRMDIRKEKGSPVTFTDAPPETTTELSEPLKEVVLLRYFEGLQQDEIAQTLALPLGTVKSRLNYARADLARRLAAHFGKEAKNG